MSKINLGDKVRDEVTGLIGIAVAKVDYLNGCVQFGVKGRVREGKSPDVEYVDEGQLGILEIGCVEYEPATPPGGIMSDAPKK